MKIAIIGLGVVGLTTAFRLKPNHVVSGYDIDPDVLDQFHQDRPLKTGNRDIDGASLAIKTNIEGHHLATLTSDHDVYIICVPGTADGESSSRLSRSMRDVLEKLSKLEGKTLLIRTTLSLEQWDTAKGMVVSTLGYHPMYAREIGCLRDTNNMSVCVIATGDQDMNSYLIKKLYDLGMHRAHSNLTPEQAVMHKLLRNMHRAQQLTFVNESTAAMARLGIDHTAVISAFSEDGELGDIPRPGYGYSGKHLGASLGTLRGMAFQTDNSLPANIDKYNRDGIRRIVALLTRYRITKVALVITDQPPKKGLFPYEQCLIEALQSISVDVFVYSRFKVKLPKGVKMETSNTSLRDNYQMVLCNGFNWDILSGTKTYPGDEGWELNHINGQ